MMDFFRKELEGDPGVTLFSPTHLCILSVTAVLLILLIIFRKRLRGFGHFTAIRHTMAAILLVNMLIHYTVRIIIGEWSIDEDLPFHLCFVTNFFMMYVLFSDNRHGLYRAVYFFTLVGPLPAMIWPDLHRSVLSWVFVQYVISHHAMLLFSMYCLTVLGYKTSAKSAAAAFFIGNAFVGLIAVFNSFAGTNYVMLGGLPERLYKLYPFLRLMPAFFWLELVAVLALIAAYVPVIIINRQNKRRKLNM